MYSRMNQVKFVKDGFKTFFEMICLNTPYHFKFFKACFPQISLSPFPNQTRSQGRGGRGDDSSLADLNKSGLP